MTDPAYKDLYRLGGWAAAAVAALTVAEVIGFTVYPAPETVLGWFELFERSVLVGLLDFWGLEFPMYLAFVTVFLALYVLLRPINEGTMALALAFVLLGSGVFFATNNPFTMRTLSERYSEAATEEERAALLAAGEVVLANTNQRAIGGFNAGLFLVSIGGVLVSAAILQSETFSRATAYVGLVAHGLSLLDYLREALTSSVVIALLLILPTALAVVVWFAMVGRRLLGVASNAKRLAAA